MQDNSIMWKPVVGYENLYEVSSNGSVRSVARRVKTGKAMKGERLVQSRAMVQGVDKGGYKHVNLSANNRCARHRVHRIVMMAFSPNKNHNILDVNHKDGNKLNNDAANLEWCTRGENHKHRYQVLGQKHSFIGRVGKLHARSKAVVGVHIKTGESVVFESANQAAIKLGMCFSKICACARGERGTHKGYAWRWYGPEEQLADLFRQATL